MDADPPPVAGVPDPDGVGELTRSTLNFPVVGIGASAGGLAALRTFFERMPADNGMAFVVVLHLSPKHASGLAELLQSVTRMPVTQIVESTPIEAGRVYVIPPTKDLSMNDGRLRLADARRPRGRHVVIDLFFRTLALVHRERAVAIVMSGTGSDGAVGIARVREHGGLTFAQTPADAQFDGMPRAALDTGTIDWTLPAAEMPAKLVELWANARRIELPPGAGAVQVDTTPAGDATRHAERALHDVMAMLRARTGHDFRHYKRATVLRRLERRLQVRGVPNLAAYRDLLAREPDEAHALLKDLLIGVTNFFRDREAFEAVERDVLPKIFEAAEPGEAMRVRVWVAGCATGEEAYSLAMLLAEQAAALPLGPPEVQVFASDIDEAAIATARAGAYPGSIVADVPAARLRQFFTQEAGGRYRIRKDVRERVLFASHNVLRDPPFSRIDLVCCRNLLIYLDHRLQDEILHTFHFALKPGGYLFLGSAESADSVPSLFTPVDKKHRIYRANAGPRAPRTATAPSVGVVARTAAPDAAAHAERVAPAYAEAHWRLLEQYAPPSVLTDIDGNIVHLSEHAGRFLLHAAGVPSHNLLTLVLPALRVELRSMLFRALQASHSVEGRRIRLSRDGRNWFVTMVARPVLQPAFGRLVLVLFNEVEDTPADDDAVGQAKDPVVRELEAELHRAGEQLQLTIEQSATSNQELEASNEELQAINEELRSTSEELETSKEELQSINEELTTVNQELKLKVEETGKINDDLQNLVTSTDVATVFVDRMLRIKRYTPRATRLFNVLPGDVGRSLLDLTHRLQTDSLDQDATEAFRTLRTIEREVAAADGCWYLMRTMPYRTTADHIDGAVLTFIDITARREAEQRLDAEERRLRMVVDSMRDYAILTLDAEGRITSWSSGAARIFGHAEADVLGQPGSVIFTPEDRAAGAPEEEMRQARDEGRAEDDRWHLRADGTRVYCSGIMTPLRDGDALLGYAKIARDLTGSRRTEREREVLLQQESAGRAEAIAAGELKDEFLAVMSHELKNPLNLIHLNAELLARLPEAKALPSVARAAEVIRKTVLSQAQIIDDLLDLSRVRTGKLALAIEAVDWGTIVATIAGALAEEAAARRIRLATEPPDAPVVVDADPVRVEQIVWNLLSNALKFTPDGGAVAVRLAAADGYGVLTVQDTGRGIDPKQLPRLFGMFQQAAAPTSRRDGGLGIGLALASQLAQAQGGSLEGTSPGPGAGSTFTARLPLHAVGTRRDAGARAPTALPRGLRVLIVDDDAEHLRILGELLRLEGAEVVAASGAAEALGAAEHQAFDVVISDIAMPDVDGYALIRLLKERPRLRTTPVIALTGMGRPGDVERALAAGFDAHLAKPATLERLVATLLDVLQRRAR